MNKVILVVALVAVGLSGWNTFLLLRITDAIQNAGQEIAPVAKQLEKLQPVLQKLSEQPTGAPPAVPGPPPKE